MPDSNPTLEQVHAYMLAHGWSRRPDDPPGREHWQHSLRDYENDGMTFPGDDQDPDWASYLSGMIETFAEKDGRCEHEVLAEILGDVDKATLLKRLERARAVDRELRERFQESNDELCALRLARPAVSGKRLEAAKRILEWIDDHAQGYGSPVIGVTHRGAQELPLRVDWLWTLLMEADEPASAESECVARILHIESTDASGEMFVGPFPGGWEGDARLDAWLAEKRSPAWTRVCVAVLEQPVVLADIPERERLVHENPELAAQIREGIAESERSETRDLGSFAQHLDDEEA